MLVRVFVLHPGDTPIDVLLCQSGLVRFWSRGPQDLQECKAVVAVKVTPWACATARLVFCGGKGGGKGKPQKQTGQRRVAPVQW